MLLSLLALPNLPVYSQDVSAYQEQGKQIKAPEAALKLGADLFGDNINMYTGGVAFSQTDVALRGNNSLSVSIGRRLSVGSKVKGSRPFGRWELEIPHIQGTYSTSDGWVTQTGTTNRCSSFSAPKASPGTNGSLWSAAEFWSGSFLHIPGAEGKRMLLRAAGFTTAPGALPSYPVVTSDHWTFECLPTLANDSTGTLGEGFVAISPEGTRYKFDWLLTYGATRLKKTDQLVQLLERKEVWLMPTVVTDRFGNTVSYTYEPARPGNLSKIQSSDGRMLTLSYGSANEAHLIKTVSDATRTWSYSHSIDGTEIDLDTVTLPDSSSWKLAGIRPLLAEVPVTEMDQCGVPLDAYAQILNGSIQHPSGATVSYTLQPVRHGRTDVPSTCVVGKRFTQTPKFFYTFSLTNRTGSCQQRCRVLSCCFS